MYIQRNFTTLLQELPNVNIIVLTLEHIFDSSEIIDINSCPGTIRPLSKLLKILMIKGKQACDELLRVIEVGFGRVDLIAKMKERNDAIERRGKICCINQTQRLSNLNYGNNKITNRKPFGTSLAFRQCVVKFHYSNIRKGFNMVLHHNLKTSCRQNYADIF